MKYPVLALLGLPLFVLTANASIDLSIEMLGAIEKKDASAEKPGGEKSGEEKKLAVGGPASAGAAPKAIKQEKALKITVRNASNKPEGGLLVRYWIISRDMKTTKLALFDGGESNTDLKPNGVNVITTDPVKSSYTQKSVFIAAPAAGGKGAPAKGAPAAKPVEAGGIKIVGYGAQVISKDGKVVAESFSEQAYKQFVGAEGNKPGPLFKAAKSEDNAPAAQ